MMGLCIKELLSLIQTESDKDEKFKNGAGKTMKKVTLKI